MVPNCIFLHLFHISRSKDFSKKKKKEKEERKRAKKHSIHKWNEGIKQQCWLVGPSYNLFILLPISFLSSFWSLHRHYLLREYFLDDLCKTAYHILSVHLPCSSQHFITLYLFVVTSSMGAWALQICLTLYPYCPEKFLASDRCPK